jgi:hypothetical protein
MDAPRNSDGQHAPEAPETNTRTPASIFHVNSIWATPALRPNRRCNATMTQTGALQHTAGIEKKTHPAAEFRRRKSRVCGHRTVLVSRVISMGRRNTQLRPEFIENKSQKRWLGQRSRNVALAGF